MRPYLFLALLALAAPADAQRLGGRTQSPETMVPGLAPGEDDLREAIAAADAHPLGSLANPIRVGGPEGERAYLFRLRCTGGGAAPRIGPRTGGGVGAFGTVTGAYRLDCGPASAQLFFDMYHEEHVEDRAPAGFTIAPR